MNSGLILWFVDINVDEHDKRAYLLHRESLSVGVDGVLVRGVALWVEHSLYTIGVI